MPLGSKTIHRLLLVLGCFIGCGLAVAILSRRGMEPRENTSVIANAAPVAGRQPATEIEAAIARFRIPEGLSVELIAAEPNVVNPVSFCFDEQGRIYVAETGRLDAGAIDIRGHMDWLDDDLACRTGDDRIALLRRKKGNAIGDLTCNSDRIRRMERNGSEVKSTLFADGFNGIADGIGSGVLARDDRVWYTCVPNLWQLRCGEIGQTAERIVLHQGYGIRIGYEGHDLHGLTFGPDGRLYFTMGDRGLHVETDGCAISCYDSGAVLRCEPDGSALEIFATGLRNPQELAFDEYGNLFTCDNSSDIGEPARWIHVVEGGDSGWRIGYQFLQQPVQGGPWYAEKLWHTSKTNTAAYIVPPIGHLATCPAGLTYHPGVALLPERYHGHFFLADFCGSSGASGIHYILNRPEGASFTLADSGVMWWRILATDVEFGPDGGLYATDWTEGWSMPQKGRIHKLYDPAAANLADCRQIQRMLAGGVGHCAVSELISRLSHPDRRIRQAAQFALANAGGGTDSQLVEAARHSPNRLVRVHAIWALGQRGRKTPTELAPLMSLLDDSDSEIRSQTARVLGEARNDDARERLTKLLKDKNRRVQFFAVQALGRIGNAAAAPAILELIGKNADQDVFLRHAAVLALARLNNLDVLHASMRHESRHIRLGVLLALRRLKSEVIQRFLDDEEPQIVLEAARAIHDIPIPEALPALAALANRPGLTESALRRVLNANFRLGGDENAATVAGLAGRPDVAPAIRVQALTDLAQWARPPARDRIIGLWRPLEPRRPDPAVAATRQWFDKLTSGSDEITQAALHTAAALKINEVAPTVFRLFSDASRAHFVRVEALKALRELARDRLDEALKLGLTDADSDVRIAACTLLAALRPNEAVAELKAALYRDSVAEKQNALALLAGLQAAGVDLILEEWMDRLVAGQESADVELDILEAARRRDTPQLHEKLARHNAARRPDDELSQFRECLNGGDSQSGWQVFYGKPAVACSRCHRINQDGGEIGPDLSHIGSTRDRRYLLESIVNPNACIAEGFATVQFNLNDGNSLTGVLRNEDAAEVRIVTADGESVGIAKNRIEARRQMPSAMPADAMNHLSKRELRDLVEFLATRK